MLHSFLAAAKLQFLAGPQPRGQVATVCVGNMAGDLDTIVSSIGDALARAQRVAGALYVPLMPFPRKEFRLRYDATVLFEHCGFIMDSHGAPQDLIFWDEVPASLASAWRNHQVRLVLTDHNRAVQDVVDLLGANIVAIVDHHNDEQAHTETVPAAERRIDVIAASACSLVVDALSHHESLPCAEIGAMLLSTIAVDTRGFNAAQHKFAGPDVRAVKWLLGKLQGVEMPEPISQAMDIRAVDEAAAALIEAPVPPAAAVGGSTQIKDLFEYIYEARHQVGHLTASDLLKLDYKRVSVHNTAIGAAGIFATMDALFEKAGGSAALMDAMLDFATETKVDILIIMTNRDEMGAKGVALLPTSAADSGAMMHALENKLTNVPEGLPHNLATQDLFISQQIPTEGFGLSFDFVAGVDQAAAFRVSKLRAQVTRKTLLPTITHFCPNCTRDT